MSARCPCMPVSCHCRDASENEQHIVNGLVIPDEPLMSGRQMPPPGPSNTIDRGGIGPVAFAAFLVLSFAAMFILGVLMGRVGY